MRKYKQLRPTEKKIIRNLHESLKKRRAGSVQFTYERTTEALGQDFADFARRIEEELPIGYSWKNYGGVWGIGFRVDVRPVACLEDIQMLLHHTNLYGWVREQPTIIEPRTDIPLTTQKLRSAMKNFHSRVELSSLVKVIMFRTMRFEQRKFASLPQTVSYLSSILEIWKGITPTKAEIRSAIVIAGFVLVYLSDRYCIKSYYWPEDFDPLTVDLDLLDEN